MLKIGICDDEPAVHQQVKKYILIEVYRSKVKYSFLQKEITYISRVQSRTEVIIGEKEYQSQFTLEDWEEILDDRLFFRIHNM